MAIINTYGLWNNKGGVGKSTITFHLAARYAEQHDDRNVLVIDLCPQANASMMLLGGGMTGEDTVLGHCTAPTPRTVVGYLSTVIANGSGAPLPDPADFLVRVSISNKHLTDNIYLLCGDGNLEPMAPAINGAASAPPLTPQAQPWRWVHLVFRRFVEDLAQRHADRDWIIFVDTNPSFSIYTELAVSAVDRLITPVNADDSSRVATNAMFILLHGQNPPHPITGLGRLRRAHHNRMYQFQESISSLEIASLSMGALPRLFPHYRMPPLIHYGRRTSSIRSISRHVRANLQTSATFEMRIRCRCEISTRLASWPHTWAIGCLKCTEVTILYMVEPFRSIESEYRNA